MRKLWAGEKGLQPQGPQRARRTPSCYAQLHTLASLISPPRRHSRDPGTGVQGLPHQERAREGPRVLIRLQGHRSHQPSPQMRWDKATQTEGRRGLLPPWLLSLGELQAPTGLGTGWLGGGGGAGRDCLARPSRKPGEAAAPVSTPERRVTQRS